MFNKVSEYEADVDESVVTFIYRSCKYIDTHIYVQLKYMIRQTMYTQGQVMKYQLISSIDSEA